MQVFTKSFCFHAREQLDLNWTPVATLMILAISDVLEVILELVFHQTEFTLDFEGCSLSCPNSVLYVIALMQATVMFAIWRLR